MPVNLNKVAGGLEDATSGLPSWLQFPAAIVLGCILVAVLVAISPILFFIGLFRLLVYVPLSIIWGVFFSKDSGGDH